MLSRDTFDTSRRNLSRTKTVVDKFGAHAKSSPSKALVMSIIGQLVADGFAVWDVFDNGDIEVRFASGEMYLLAEATIRRFA